MKIQMQRKVKQQFFCFVFLRVNKVAAYLLRINKAAKLFGFKNSFVCFYHKKWHCLQLSNIFSKILICYELRMW